MKKLSTSTTCRFRMLCVLYLFISVFTSQAQSILDSCYTSASPAMTFISSSTLINSFDADLLDWTGTMWNGAFPNANVTVPPPCNTPPVRAVWIGDGTAWTTGGEAFGLKFSPPLVAGNTYNFFFTYVSDGFGSNGIFSPEVYTNNSGVNGGNLVGNFIPAGNTWATHPVTFTATPAQAGDDYIVIHTIVGSGMVLNLCAETITDLGNDSLTICFGDSAVLFAGQGFQSYNWSTGATTQQITVHNSGMYISTNQGFCGTSSDTIIITVDPCGMFPVAVFSTPDNHICPGTCTDFTNLSQNATTYTWTFGGATPSTSTDVNPTSICYNTPGTYPVELIADNGLTSDTLILNNFITVYPYPAPQGILQSGDTLFSNAGATSYQWYYAGNAITGATDYFYVATQSGNYNVVATDINGCEVEAVIFDVAAGLATANMMNDGISLFPNPAENELTIESGLFNGTQVIVSLYNVAGEKIFCRKIEKALHTLSIDISGFTKGAYTIEVEAGEKILRSRFIKK
jgi:hypothetical protein